MNRVLRSLPLLLAFCFALSVPTWAQFGKNKVTYQTFDWQVYRSTHFDVHYYPEMEPFLEDIVSYVESSYVDISELLDHELRFRVPLVVYKTKGEFQSTNILLSELPDGVAAFAEPVQYRMVLPIDLPPDELYKLIAHELTHIFQYSLFYDGYLGRALRGRAPAWIMEGMASYVAQDESTFDQMIIRDAVVNNVLPPIQTLNQVTFLTYRYGHAIFDYIEEEHGIEGLRTFLYEFKKVLLTGNVSRAVKEAFGYDIDEFNRRFNRYLRQRYFPILLEKKSPDEYGEEIAARKLRRNFVMSPSVSPSGELVAVLSVPNGLELDLTVLSAEDGSIVKNVSKGFTNRYRELVSRAFDGKRDISWSPVADEIAIFVRKEDKWPLMIFDALTGKVVKKFVFDDLLGAGAPAFSPDGTRIAFEANQNGVVDLFEVEVATGEVRNVTQDDFFDTNPWYSPDGESLLYNRRIGEHWKIFTVDLNDSERKTQITFGLNNDLQPSYSRDGETIYFSSDRGENEIYNIHALELTSGDIKQYTDVVGGCFAPQELAERDGQTSLVFQAFFEGLFRNYRLPLLEAEAVISADERLQSNEEAEPFEPQLRLTLDEAAKEPYKLAWDLEAPTVGVGVADDGTFLSNAALNFSDLLGNHRFTVIAQSVSNFQQYRGQYVNFKRRFNWGASAYDERDFVFISDIAGRVERREAFQQTGASVFLQYPFSRNYRIDTSLGYLDATSIVPTANIVGNQQFARFEDQFAIASVGITGDTTRSQRWGAFQGKRISLSTRYGSQIDGDSAGDFLEHRADMRFYKKVTRRSTLAWRVGAVINDGDRESSYGFGGLNQLRGYDFREFIGSNLAYSNLEFRFPLVDVLRFPVLTLFDLRGFLFMDVGAAWFNDDVWYDPETFAFREDLITGESIDFKFWDSDNDRLQDGRGSFGFGFQVFFLGGLQLNWVWSERMDTTQYVFDQTAGNLVPVEVKGGDRRSDFYIAFDW